jgi:hypothetical protein
MRRLDHLFLTYELYDLVLLECELTLNIVVSPEDESSLLLRRCVVCLTLSDEAKIYTTFKELHGKMYWQLSGICCLRLQGTRIQRQEFLYHIGTPPYLQDHRTLHRRLHYWLPIYMFLVVLYCRRPFHASCASLPLGAHLCMKYCVTSSMGWIYCLTVLSCRMGFCTLLRNSRHASPCLQRLSWC